MPMCTTGAGPAAALLGSSGPTVLLDANWATDTIVDDGLVPIADGNPVDVWTMATGGDFNYTTAAVAGASAQPIWVAASGVHTAGNNAALTTATPITIPANTDCLIYVAFNLADSANNFIPLGSTTSGGHVLFYDSNNYGVAIANGAQNATEGFGTGTLVGSGAGLWRLRRVSGVWKSAATGCAEVDGDGGIGSASVSFDTLLANLAPGNSFYSASGNYIKAIKITKGTSTPDSAYETTYNGGPL